MTSKQFLIFVFVGLASIAAIIIPVNMYADIYGLFRPARGRPVTVYGEERVAKYLHSFRYIPENFDGVLLGSSVSVILDVRDFDGHKIYNASIDGGNVEDLRPIAKNIYRKGKFKLTIICIHRYLTNDHDTKTDMMTPKQYWAALGSPQLITAYVSRLAISLGVVGGKYDEYGTLHPGGKSSANSVQKNIDEAVADIRRGTAPVGNYYIDPVALKELQDVIALARQHSDQLVIFYPPIPRPVLAVRSVEFARYRGIINGLLEPRDIVMDFNSPKYEGLRSDPQNFVDAVHLSKTGASVVMSELSKTVQRPYLERSASLR